ncbi:hypothetical protein VTN49DRAFT_6769 [Thermomyces lanuginosus]|uniref:uncharacterized protein n=1 Tax=Thermomyces lanuginosus TaxID=5541 RepID=UPI003742913C
MSQLPQSILIVGGGVFGLSTALSLSHRYPTHNITLLEASTTIPNPEGSSVDSSRIVRADYANAAYARLAAEGIERWRNTEWGAEGRYTQNGLVLVYHKSSGDAGQGDDGERYTRASYENVKRLANGDEKIVRFLPDRNAIHGVFPRNTVHVAETVVAGYVNWGSGWADAEAGVRYARKKLEELGVVKIRTDQKVSRLLFSDEKDDKKKVAGVQLADGSTITADLVILATGAWTPGLLDLRGLADARGQVLAYLRLTDEEQARLANMPTLLSFSTGMFIIPPRNNELKIARHAYGYRNPTRVRLDSSADVAEEAEVSLPETGRPIPPEGEEACRAALREMLPWLADRPFFKTRVCWYTDTPQGDFLVTYHPDHPNLFLATGGSGHAYKFFPVLGDKIVDALEGKLDEDLRRLWSWPAQRPSTTSFVTKDGSRSGRKDMILAEEYARGSKL